MTKCDHSGERYAIAMQLGALVGCIWVSARWACVGEGKPTQDWEQRVEDLKKVVGWFPVAASTGSIRVYYPEDPQPAPATHPCT